MGRPRIEMPLSRQGVLDVLSLGRYNHTSARPGLSEHAHEGAMEICYLVKGHQTYRVGAREYRLNGGDVFVTFPGERHDTAGFPEEKGVLYWMVLRVSPSGGGFLGVAKAQGRALLRALRGITPRHFRGSWTMKEHLDAVTRLFHLREDPVRVFAMANRIGAFLLEVVASAQSARSATPPRPLQPILAFIEQHLDEAPAVSRLAAQAGLSVPRFKARFRQEFGVPPAEYVLRARIEEARRRLTDGNASITQIAFDLGFSSSQYFATVFKRFAGHPPGVLRNRARGEFSRSKSGRKI